ncbi:MAG: DUF503 domain-containing protein [Planctomycetes bacterium]|nr:DUF503 domain-containing protein [Planctomycetota bacterium]
MLIAILQFELLIHGAESLKDKRRVVSSLKDRLHADYQASVAEVGLQDLKHVARLGLAVVGSDGRYLGQVLDRITMQIRAIPGAELSDCSREIIHNGEGMLAAELLPGKDAPDAELAQELLRRAEEAA